MRRLFADRGVVLIVLVLVAVRASAQKTTLPPPVVPEGFGVNIHFTRAESAELDLLRDGGSKFVRMDFAWGGVERAKGVYTFENYDRLVADMSGRGIRCLFILDYGNRLYDGGVAPHSDEGRQAFANFAAAAAERYAGKGILWEIWNEPNHPNFWKPKPDPESYAKLVKATVPAIRAADPDAFVCGPASSEFAWEYQEALGKLGVFSLFDAVSVHPYRQGVPETAGADYLRLRALLHRYVPGRTIPILSGEWGYSTAWRNFDDETQADYLVRQRLVNLASGVPLSIWYDWRDDGLDPREAEHHFGTVFRDFRPKPSYVAGTVLADTLRGYEYVRRIPMPGENDWVLVFRKPRKPIRNEVGQPLDTAIAFWTTDAPRGIDLRFDQATLVTRDGGRREIQPHPYPSHNTITVPFSRSPQYLLLAPSAHARQYSAWGIASPAAVVAPDGTACVEVETMNPFPFPHRGRFDVVVDEQVVGSLNIFEHGNERVRHSIPVRYPRRDRATVPARVEFDGPTHAVSKLPGRVDLIVAEPLMFEVLPRASDVVPMLVRNPSGRPAKVRLVVSVASDDVETPAELDANPSETVVMVKLPPDTRDVPPTLKVLGETGTVIARSSSPDYGPLPLLVDIANHKVPLDGARDVAGAAKVSLVTVDSPPVPGLTKAIQLDYQFADGWKFLAWQPSNHLVGLTGKPKALSFWLHGDGSRNLLRLRFRDAGGQTFQPTHGPIDWTGWRWVSIPLTSEPGTSHWGGANDGLIQHPIRLENPIVIDNAKQRVDKPLRVLATGFTLRY